MLRATLLLLAATAVSAFQPLAMGPASGLQLRSSSFCPQAAALPKTQNTKATVRMGLEDITDTSSLGFVKGVAFFGASFVPSFFLAGYFLGGYFPGLAVGAQTEPAWWPTSMQYAHGVPKGTLNANVAKIEAKEAELKEAKAKADAAKKAAKKAAAGAAAATVGFSGVPTDFERPGPTAFASEPTEQTFLGMRGPRAPGHRENYGGKHAATMLAIAALLWQPVSEAGMYSMEGGSLTKKSFNSLEVPGFGNVKKVPNIESFFPFSKTGFEASPTLFSKGSMIVVEDPRDGCGALNQGGSCHTFLDEISDALKKSPETMGRTPVKQTTFFPWTLQKLD
mmetsp:Transcript_48100/g.75119  ORF Transcript_48100/g.75119 Transcript_48100/m.75119 type:complete len:337 (+) Transcript_48100:3-1013(+)